MDILTVTIAIQHIALILLKCANSRKSAKSKFLAAEFRKLRSGWKYQVNTRPPCSGWLMLMLMPCSSLALILVSRNFQLYEAANALLLIFPSQPSQACQMPASLIF